MSEPELTSTKPEVDNVGLMEVSWNGDEFECTAKNIPQLKERPVWFVQTDKMSVGRAVCGTSEGFEPFELTTPFDLRRYRELNADATIGTVGPAVFKYLGTTPNIKISVPDCQIIGVVAEAGESNGAASMTVKIQAKGGILKTSTDSPIVIGDVSGS